MPALAPSQLQLPRLWLEREPPSRLPRARGRRVTAVRTARSQCPDSICYCAPVPRRGGRLRPALQSAVPGRKRLSPSPRGEAGTSTPLGGSPCAESPSLSPLPTPGLGFDTGPGVALTLPCQLPPPLTPQLRLLLAGVTVPWQVARSPNTRPLRSILTGPRGLSRHRTSQPPHHPLAGCRTPQL